MSISGDANIIAIGVPDSDKNKTDNSHAQLYNCDNRSNMWI